MTNAPAPLFPAAAYRRRDQPTPLIIADSFDADAPARANFPIVRFTAYFVLWYGPYMRVMMTDANHNSPSKTAILIGW